MMATEERNFRSYYHEKLGFRVVEEKKSVEILLKEQTVSIEKLQQFCLRFSVPNVYRVLVWKFLLGVLPANQESTQFVTKQRVQQYEDLCKGLETLRRAKESDQPETRLLKLYLLEQGQLPFQDSELVVGEDNRNFTAIAASVCKVTEDEFDQYWIASRFFQHIAKHKEPISHYLELTLKCLKKEDGGRKLWNHVVEHKLFTLLPLKDWYASCFANILPGLSFQRLWDKMIGGSFYIMVYVTVAILLFFQRPLLSMKSSEDMVNFLQKISDDCGDSIVNHALELWAKNGSCLLMSKSDSPIVAEKGKG